MKVIKKKNKAVILDRNVTIRVTPEMKKMLCDVSSYGEVDVADTTREFWARLILKCREKEKAEH